MLPVPLEHRFTLDGESYLLVQCTRGGDRRIRTEYALAIAAAPAIIDSLDGDNLVTEAIARECLKEAPAFFWEEAPAFAQGNGQPRRVLTCEHVPLALWEAFRKEVQVFRDRCFPGVRANTLPVDDPGQGTTAELAPAQALSPSLRGRAE